MLQFVTLAFLPLTAALVGYDCGGESLNVTTLSLLDVGKCEIEDIEPNKKETYIQLMQLSDYDEIKAIQCKIEVDRTITYCGMHSHTSTPSA